VFGGVCVCVKLKNKKNAGTPKKNNGVITAVLGWLIVTSTVVLRVYNG
jgi:hypothetical protein